MTCAELSERMPAVAAGRGQWTEAELAHLRGCDECRREWEIVSAGSSVAAQVTVDADALAVRVLARLRAEPKVRPLRRLTWVSGLAAAAAVVLYVVTAPSPDAPDPAAARFMVEVPGLAGLEGDALAEVLEALDSDWTTTSTNDVPSLGDLTPGELAQVGQTLES